MTGHDHIVCCLVSGCVIKSPASLLIVSRLCPNLTCRWWVLFLQSTSHQLLPEVPLNIPWRGFPGAVCRHSISWLGGSGVGRSQSAVNNHQSLWWELLPAGLSPALIFLYQLTSAGSDLIGCLLLLASDWINLNNGDQLTHQSDLCLPSLFLNRATFTSVRTCHSFFSFYFCFKMS